VPDSPERPDPYSESDTRQQLIDQQLRLAGWNVRDPSQVIQELDIVVADGVRGAVREAARPYEGHQFADYGLMLRGRPAAVVEAKKTSRDARVGQEQAKQYADGLQRVYGGAAPFVMFSNGHNTFFWDTDLYPPAKVFGFPSPLDLEWMMERRTRRAALSVELINTRIAGRDYQIEGIRTLLDAMEHGRRKFLMVMATGTGKTRTAVALVDTLMRARWVKRVLFLVDRIALQEQALDAFKEHLPAEPFWPREGDRGFVRDRRVYVTTYPTMLNLIEAGTTPERWISPFFFDLIVADESHRSIYNTYKQVVRYFHGLTLGLTATPRDQVAHDTFDLFDCPHGEPTFAYSYEEAVRHEPPYLCEFEVLKLRTRFQVEGIRGPRLDAHEQEQLELEGFDPETIDFEGTDLEMKVANSGTNAQIVREFMEESIKDPSGTLPGKSIIFACSIAHARRLQDLFDQLYPEHHGRLARVMVSDDARVHGKGGLLDQFKTRDMPRVAISVDMLDTGVDVLEAVNLVFAKPVYSRVKFWQMIGRGTRVLPDDRAQRKPWCPEKDRFLIMDCWGNFEYFDMHPKSREPGTQVPLPVRLFRARLDHLAAALASRSLEAVPWAIRSLRADIQALPANNVDVMEAQAQLARVHGEGFWARPNEGDLRYLRETIAPVLRAQSGLEPKAVRFEIDVVDFGTAMLVANRDGASILRDAIVQQVTELPMGVNLVARERKLIEAVLGDAWWAEVTHERLDELIARLGPLMRFRREEQGSMVSLHLADLTAVHERIPVGTGGADLAIGEYRKRVEEAVRRLLADNEVLQRLQAGEAVTEADLRTLAELLRRQDPTMDEERLRRAFDVRSASFVQLIRHALGVERLERFPTAVNRSFDEFIAAHTTYSAPQIRFLQTLRTFLLQRRQLDRQDLVAAPFTQLDPNGIRGVFSAGQIEEVITFAQGLVA
jgi:type I restriction enzyme R subunit